jgi:hypothetical protein
MSYVRPSDVLKKRKTGTAFEIFPSADPHWVLVSEVEKHKAPLTQKQIRNLYLRKGPAGASAIFKKVGRRLWVDLKGLARWYELHEKNTIEPS